MKRRINLSLILVGLFAASGFALQQSSRNFQRTAPLSAGRTFSLDHSNGNVNIHAQSRSDVDIRAVMQCTADTEAEARTFCDGIQVSVQENAGNVSVRTQYPSNDSRRNRGFHVDYDISLPDSALLDVRNRFGKVIISDAHAGTVVNNSNGDVLFSGGRGRLQIENS